MKSLFILLINALYFKNSVLISMRPIQWSKNLLIFLPLVFSVQEKWSTDELSVLAQLLAKVSIGAIILCILSGSIYIMNDVFDKVGDSQHPRKQNRPVASGILPVKLAILIAILLMILAIISCFLLNTRFGILATSLVAMNLGYSSFFKNIVILDVLIVGTAYLLRVVGGALLIEVSISPWIYSTVGLGALFIALAKRYSELRSAGTLASNQRAVLGLYSLPFLMQLITVTSTATLVAYSLYTFTSNNVPNNHSMMLTIPLVIFGLFRYLYLINHTNEAENPEFAIIHDWQLAIVVPTWAVSAIIILIMARSCQLSLTLSN